jgi:hypothetical protein
MHRSHALFGAFTMREHAVRRPETGRFLSGGTLASSSSMYVTVLGAGRQDHAASHCRGHGQDRAVRRGGVVPRTDDQPLSDRYGPAGRVLTTQHAAGEPTEHQPPWPHRRNGGPLAWAAQRTAPQPLILDTLARRKTAAGGAGLTHTPSR